MEKLSGGGKVDACLRCVSDQIRGHELCACPDVYLLLVIQRVFCNHKRGLFRKCPRSVLTLSSKKRREGKKRKEQARATRCKYRGCLLLGQDSVQAGIGSGLAMIEIHFQSF